MALALPEFVSVRLDHFSSATAAAHRVRHDGEIELRLHRPGRSAQVRAWLGGVADGAPGDSARSPLPVALAIALAAWIAVACSVLSS